MNDPFFPPPSIDPEQKLSPLQRLRMYDSLMITADRWLMAHDYHRQRQNVLYQSLHQPGIVYGLGVCKTDAPRGVSAKFRQQPWLKVQPGIAIDWEGNPIIVPKAVDFPLNFPATSTNELVNIYLVISYRDPEQLSYKSDSETIQETFRIDQKNSVPTDGEVELCRFLWQAGNYEIEHPKNPLSPQINELDFNHRYRSGFRPKATVSITTLNTLSDKIRDHLKLLMNSVATLYPPLTGRTLIDSILLISLEKIAKYDLLYLSITDLHQLKERELSILDKYTASGGVILIENNSSSDRIKEIAEFVQTKFKFNSNIWQKTLTREHPLRNQPFLFVALPEINRYPIELWHNDNGIILIEGNLSAAWGYDEELFLSRNDIRTAQEFGINILHYAWQRKHFMSLINSGF